MPLFHIHVDATSLKPAFESFLLENGFVRTDFAGHPEGADAFEAPNHLTLKLTDSVAFQQSFDRVIAKAEETSGLDGYVEGEFIPLDADIPDRPYREGVAAPFRADSGNIEPGSFRETEIHVTLDRNRSDRRLLDALTRMGFFSAYMNKPYGVAQIFTVQGSRGQIDRLLPKLLEYLEACGGTSHCSVKEERVAKWWLSSDSVSLPPVIKKIGWEGVG